MARRVGTDFLQDNSFWLMDVAPVEPLAIPLFSPLAGFSAITTPELTLEAVDITEGNALFRKRIVKKGDVGTITLQRGATFHDSDFYRWILAALRGSTGGFSVDFTFRPGVRIAELGGVTPRRDLLLIQYFRRTPLNVSSTADAGAALNAALVGAAALSTGAGATLGAVGAEALVGLAVSPLGPFEVYPKIPARAWLLGGCLPTRYKPSGDFDATSGQVSVMELEVAVESMEEISLAS